MSAQETTTTTAAAAVKEWRPPSLANFDAQNPGWSHRFADKNPGNRRGDRLQYWLNQGWEVAPYGNEGMRKNRDTGASSQDSAVHYRGLVLIRCPRSMVEQRNKFYREKHQRIMGAAQRMRELKEASNQANRESRRKLTSAFAEARIQKGDRILEDSKSDSAHPEAERIMRDADPAAIKEIQDRMAQLQEQQRALADENRRLREEAEERRARPSDRRRKSFPTS